MGLICKPRPTASVFSGLTLDDLLADLFVPDGCGGPAALPPLPPSAGVLDDVLEAYLAVSPAAAVAQQAYALSSTSPLRDIRAEDAPAAPRGLSLSNPANCSPQSAYLAASAAAGFMAAAPPPPPPPPPSNTPLFHAAPSNNSSSPSNSSSPANSASNNSASNNSASASLSPSMPVVKERRRPGKKPRAGRRFACKICNSTFSRKDNLATHARVHTGERPYSCSTCDRTFMWPSSARTHELTHTRVGRKRRTSVAAPESSGASASAPALTSAPAAPTAAAAVPKGTKSQSIPASAPAPRTARGTFASRAAPPASLLAPPPTAPRATVVAPRAAVVTPKVEMVVRRPQARAAVESRPHSGPHAQPAQPMDLVHGWNAPAAAGPPTSAPPEPSRPVPAPLPLAAMGRGEDALLSLEGLLAGNDESVYEQGAAVTPAQPPVATGESPMFGAGVDARLSVDDLERCMENVLADGSTLPSPPPGSDHCDHRET